jgi:hypothetical protein
LVAAVIVGGWTDSSSHTHGFLLSGGVFQSLDFPLAAGTTAMGINDSNVTGAYADSSNELHGLTGH